MKPTFYIYIIECTNGHFYTGYTNDIEKRYADHLAGKASKYTRSFRPVRVAACWGFCGDKGLAMRVEAFVKRSGREKKVLLVQNPGLLRDFVRGGLGVDVEFYVCG